MIELLKALLEDMFKNVHGSDCDDKWVLHDEDLTVITNILTARRATTVEKAEDAIGEFVRLTYSRHFRQAQVWDSKSVSS